jgi:predicted NodU family carbamoyl transferase
MILSFDGAGDDGLHKHVLRRQDGIRLVRKYPYWLGRIYKSQKDLVEACATAEKKEGKRRSPAKLMALAAYGKKRPEWHPLITNYIKNFHTLGTRVLETRFTTGKRRAYWRNSESLFRWNRSYPWTGYVTSSALGRMW